MSVLLCTDCQTGQSYKKQKIILLSNWASVALSVAFFILWSITLNDFGEEASLAFLSLGAIFMGVPCILKLLFMIKNFNVERKQLKILSTIVQKYIQDNELKKHPLFDVHAGLEKIMGYATIIWPGRITTLENAKENNEKIQMSAKKLSIKKKAAEHMHAAMTLLSSLKSLPRTQKQLMQSTIVAMQSAFHGGKLLAMSKNDPEVSIYADICDHTAYILMALAKLQENGDAQNFKTVQTYAFNAFALMHIANIPFESKRKKIPLSLIGKEVCRLFKKVQEITHFVPQRIKTKKPSLRTIKSVISKSSPSYSPSFEKFLAKLTDVQQDKFKKNFSEVLGRNDFFEEESAEVQEVLIFCVTLGCVDSIAFILDHNSSINREEALALARELKENPTKECSAASAIEMINLLEKFAILGEEEEIACAVAEAIKKRQQITQELTDYIS